MIWLIGYVVLFIAFVVIGYWYELEHRGNNFAGVWFIAAIWPIAVPITTAIWLWQFVVLGGGSSHKKLQEWYDTNIRED